MFSQIHLKQSPWQTLVVFTLAFWLSGSLLLDALMMPMLYLSGMMTSPGFASAGYSMFWAYNRVELLCAALLLTGALALHWTQRVTSPSNPVGVMLSSLLLVVALVCTYGLTPQMSALGLQLDLFNSSSEPSALMNSLHASYWVLEALKLVAGGILLRLFYRAAIACNDSSMQQFSQQ